MSSTLIEFVETRVDAMNGVRSSMEVRIPAPPPVTPSSSARTSARKRLVKPPRRNSKMLTESLHESFGWLEEYVDIKYGEMMKRNSASLSSQSFESALSSREFDLTPKGSTDQKGHHRMHSRRESILTGLDQCDLQAIVEP